jgi:hypothetical protein
VWEVGIEWEQEQEWEWEWVRACGAVPTIRATRSQLRVILTVAVGLGLNDRDRRGSIVYVSTDITVRPSVIVPSSGADGRAVAEPPRSIPATGKYEPVASERFWWGPPGVV